MRLDDVGAGPDHREPVADRGVLRVEHGVHALEDRRRRGREDHGGDDGQHGGEPEVPHHQQQGDAAARPHPGVARQGERKPDA